MLAKGKKVASAALEASESDIQYRNGGFEVVGTDRKISLFETAKRAKEMGESLDTKDKADTPLTFPNGCHIAEVEIDPDTGFVDLVTYTAVDDCGNPLDTTIVEGQVHGSIAQGLGQALTENAVYDSTSGQLVSGSFMDYGMPRAHHMPVELREALHPVPAKSNALGVKGTGEAGTTAAIAAVMNAIAHAIPNGAADHMDMPATPAKVWDACQQGDGEVSSVFGRMPDRQRDQKAAGTVRARGCCDRRKLVEGVAGLPVQRREIDFGHCHGLFGDHGPLRHRGKTDPSGYHD